MIHGWCWVYVGVLQGVAYLPPGLRISKTRRGVAYEHGVAWKVVDEDNTFQCCAFMHCNWAFIN